MNKEVSLSTMCEKCLKTLVAFNDFHETAVSSQEKIIKAFKDYRAEEKLSEALKDEKASSEKASNSQKANETFIEFLSIENEIEIVDFCEISNDETDQIDIKSDEPHYDELESKLSQINQIQDCLECKFCTKTYKRESHLKRHIAKLHKDGKMRKTRKLERRKFSCNLCGKKFVREDHYEDHVKEISCVSLDKPECRICNEVFSCISQLQEHINLNHPEGRKHFCQICFKSFPTSSNKNSHMETHNPENSIKCLDCNQGFKSVLYLRKHQKAIHTKIEKVCMICDRKFESQLKFDYHVKSHDLVKRYKCEFEGCDKSFIQHHHLENHKTTHNGFSKFLCFKCGKEFRQDCNLKVHLKSHEGEKNAGKIFKCSYQDCGKLFHSSSSYRSHKDTHGSHSQCPECGKKFTQKSSLRAHFQTHFRNPGNKPFKCTQANCNRSFYQERSVKYHVRTAHGIGERIQRKKSSLIYFCDFCPESFILQSLLRRHMMTHIEDEKLLRKHQCDKCEARFKRPEHLKLHINSVHLKLRPYKCEKCDKSFTQIGDRNVHMKIHSDEKPHMCFCKKSFRLAKGLRAHQKTHGDKKVFKCVTKNIE